MGGFAIDTSKLSENFFPGNRTRLVLTPTGLLYFLHAKPHLFNYISKDDIIDKSKASKFAKTIVCIQASWFMIQCITRMALHLPISLLELTTFVHALCTLVVYGLWWEKPLDIEVPTVIPIEDSDTQVLVAAMVMQSKIGRQKSFHNQDVPKLLRGFLRAELEPKLKFEDRATAGDFQLAPLSTDRAGSERAGTPVPSTPSRVSSQADDILRDKVHYPGLILHSNDEYHGFICNPGYILKELSQRHVLFKPANVKSMFVVLNPEDQRCLQLAAAGMKPMPTELLVPRAEDWHSNACYIAVVRE